MFLPHELIIQILLRLPVKSLIRFKCVCKSWFSLISHDPHFANSHFQLTSTAPDCKILFIKTLSHKPLSIDFEALLDDYNASVSLNLDSIFSKPFTNFEIKGSCRGFILFCSSSDTNIWNQSTGVYKQIPSEISIWNPSTGVHKQIPLSPFGSNLDADYFYGFGYDHSTDDYLVVLLSPHDSDNAPFHLEYFSLKANTWKEVEGPHFPYGNPNPFWETSKGGSLYNGAIHWLLYRNDLQRDVIVVFDLMEKKLSYMLQPQCDHDDGSPMPCGLWVYGEFLSVYALNYANDTVGIFVMKEYKVNSSWTMTLALPIDVTPEEYFSPVCCTKSGDIVGTDGGIGLVKYDKNGQFVEHHCYTNDNARCQVTMYVEHYYANNNSRRQMTMYIESLLSLPSDGDNQQA